MYFYYLILMLQFCKQVVWADICQADLPPKGVTNNSEVDYVVIHNSLITCPGPEDPPEYTACCYYYMDDVKSDNETSAADSDEERPTGPTCCSPDAESVLFYFISDQLALLIAVSVTALLLIITIIIIVCCFWSRCPLYMMCRVRYRQDDIIAYASKDDETTNLNDMPPEEQKGVTVYSPNAVKVTLKDDI